MSNLYNEYARPLSNFCIKELRQKLLEWKNSLRDELQGLKLLRSNINKNQGKIKRNESQFKSKITELVNRFENVILNEIETITSVYYEIEREGEYEVNSKVYVKFELLRENYNKIMMNINRLLLFSNGNNIKSVFNQNVAKNKENENYNNENELNRMHSARENNLNYKENLGDLLSKSPMITYQNYDGSKTPNKYDLGYDISFHTNKIDRESKSQNKTLRANGNNENNYNVDNELKEIEERINNMKTKTSLEKSKNNLSKTKKTNSKIGNISKVGKFSKINNTTSHTINSKNQSKQLSKKFLSNKDKNVSTNSHSLSGNTMNVNVNNNVNNEKNNHVQNQSNFYELNKEIEIIKNYVFDLKQKVNESTPIEFKKDNFFYLKDSFLKLKNDKERMRKDLDDLKVSFNKIEIINDNLSKENDELKKNNELLLNFIYDKFPGFDPNILYSKNKNNYTNEYTENKIEKTRNKLITNSSKYNDTKENKSTKENFNQTNPFLYNKISSNTRHYKEVENEVPIQQNEINKRIFKDENDDSYYKDRDYGVQIKKKNDGNILSDFNDFNNTPSVELKKVLNQQIQNKATRYLIPKK